MSLNPHSANSPCKEYTGLEPIHKNVAVHVAQRGTRQGRETLLAGAAVIPPCLDKPIKPSAFSHLTCEMSGWFGLMYHLIHEAVMDNIRCTWPVVNDVRISCNYV